MSKVRNDNYVLIQGWMVSELGLKGNDLLIYAIIHGFSQAEDQVFKASLQYLCDWTNSTKESVRKCLNKLTERGLIVKADESFRGRNYIVYYTTKLYQEYNFSDGEYNLVASRIQQSCPNNIEDNISNNTSIESRRFKPPTEEEVMEFCEENGYQIDAERFVSYYQSTGWRIGKAPMKNWKAAVRTWVRRDSESGRSEAYRAPTPAPRTVGVHFESERRFDDDDDIYFDPGSVV